MTVLHAWEDGGIKWRIIETASGAKGQFLGIRGNWADASTNLLARHIAGSMVAEIVRLLPALTADELATIERARRVKIQGLTALLAIIDRLTGGGA